MQMPVQQPVQQYQPMPQAQPYPQVQQGSDGGAMARVMEELAAIREEQKNRTEAELANARLLVEFERLRGDMRQYGGMNMVGMQQNAANNNQAIPADVVIALLEAVKGGNAAPVNITNAPAALPQSVEESATVSTPTMYPADAIVTTTTTVDTTQKPVPKRTERSSRDEFSDVDGFYDSIDY